MTQEYTPVAWQDETTSQQGTLINAERLNQMQTAHHYADGLEEVDAIPTADPGVSYHKIVYCTADSTIYRWDGTQWTKDIDDDTKRLLLEHEADHANPHQVTKAQVGLGNADNTSDQNKPVSTAQAAAIKLVQDYLDAHEANHSNPHAVTKAQVGLGNADNTADADKPISTAAQTALNAKADKATTYTKTETDTLLAEKADKATTLAGYGITDAYTKTETDTLLALKADQATTYTKSEVNTALALKADKSDTYTKAQADTAVQNALDNYATMVRTANNQTISGIKTFTQGIIAYPEGWHPCAQSTPQGKYGIFAKIHPTSPGAYHVFEFMQSSNTASAYGRLILHEVASDPLAVWIDKASKGGNDPIINPDDLVILGDGTDLYLAWRRSPPYGGLTAREYLGMSYGAIRSQGVNVTWYSNAEAIILDNLDGYTQFPVSDYTVHTYGNETIAGAKTFTGQMLATGQRAYSAGNTTDVATIGTLDAYSPMVRTTGAQEIGGNKSLTGETIISGTLNNKCKYYGSTTAANNYERIATLTPGSLGGTFVGMIYSTKGHAAAYRARCGIFFARVRSNDLNIVWMIKGSTIVEKQLYLTYDGSTFELWGLVSYDAANEALGFTVLSESNAGQIPYNLVHVDNLDVVKTETELSQYQLSTYSS